MSNDLIFRCSVCLVPSGVAGDFFHLIDAVSRQDKVQEQIVTTALALKLVKDRADLDIAGAGDAVWVCATCHRRLDQEDIVVVPPIPTLDYVTERLDNGTWTPATLLKNLDTALKSGDLKEYNGLFHIVSRQLEPGPFEHLFICLPPRDQAIGPNMYQIFDRVALSPAAERFHEFEGRDVPSRVVDLSYEKHLWRFPGLKTSSFLPALLYKLERIGSIEEMQGIHGTASFAVKRLRLVLDRVETVRIANAMSHKRKRGSESEDDMSEAAADALRERVEEWQNDIPPGPPRVDGV
ncbi:hypothetical protein HMN09_00970100 [Mycena chlorophos]|uniref:Uncharacterized protein n=1 Tax=Mycena chlorophos TaxID=658473 RepID=A0A8H6SIU8_MYCCL|nr:hypothetical protein HMN09_00970100 [Mycena chlorophos]